MIFLKKSVVLFSVKIKFGTVIDNHKTCITLSWTAISNIAVHYSERST